MLEVCDGASVHLKHFSKVLFTLSNQDGIIAESQTNQFHIQQVSCVAQRLGSLFWSVKTDPFPTCFSNPLFPPFQLLSQHRPNAVSPASVPPLRNSRWAFQEKITIINFCVGVCLSMYSSRWRRQRTKPRNWFQTEKIVWEPLQLIAHRRLN